MAGYISCSTNRTQTTLEVHGLWSDEKTIGGYQHSLFQNGSWRVAAKHMFSGGPTTYVNIYFDWGGLSPGTSYPVRIEWFTADGNTSRGFSTGTCSTASPPSPPPSMPTNFRVYDKPSPTSVSLAWNTVSGATSYGLTVRHSATGTVVYSNTSLTGGSALVTGLVNGVTYTASVYASNAGGSSPSNSITFKAGPDRPNDWVWSIPKTKGSSYTLVNNRFTNLLSHSEMTAFRSRINEFRIYKGLDAYSWGSMPHGSVFTATNYNQMESAISAMNPPTSTYGQRSPGSTAYTLDELLNRLQLSLNSIQ